MEYWPQVEFAVHSMPKSGFGDLTITAVDGSRSPKLTRRLGGDFAVYSAGILTLSEKKVVESRFVVGRVDSIGEQIVDMASIPSAKSLAAERAAAEAALDAADLVLLDGSFYGFAGEVINTMRATRARDPKDLGEWSDALQAILRFTEELVKSGKCL